MSKRSAIYSSTVAQKLLMGLTGLFLCSFLIVHLAGNLLLFKNDGGTAFNAYAEFMSTNLVIRILEIVLIAGFLLHIIFGVLVWLDGRRARPQQYAMSRPSETSSILSRLAFWTGSFVFIFLVVHMYSFWAPARFGTIEGSMYNLVKTAFESPAYDAFYVAALFLLGCHLRHGFQSAFQTLGVRPGWRRPLDMVAIIFWLLFPAAFATMPLYFLYGHLMGGN